MRAFTLGEVLIVVSIIMIIGSIGMINFSLAFQKSNLKIGLNQLSQEIEKMRNYSLVFLSNQIPPPKGYGIEIQKNAKSYFIFNDENGNGKREAGETFEKKDLPSKVEISEIEIKKKDGTSLNSNTLYIVFFPPYPKVEVRTPASSEAISDWKFVRIQVKIENKTCPKWCKEFKINPLGVIEK